MTPFYDRDGITLFNADMRDVLGRELEVRVDLIVTDPPYNAGKNYGATTNDRMEWPDWCAWFDDCLDLMTEAAPVVFCFMSQTALRKYLRHGRREPDWLLTWVKPLSLAVCAVPFMPHWEPIAYWGKTRKKGGNFWGSDVLTHNVVAGKYGHPTEKPVPLLRDLLTRLKPADRRATVCDPFAGSGTTLRAAKDIGMDALGIEINPAYCAMAERRLSQGVLALEAVG